MLGSVLPLAISFFLLFSPPDGLSEIGMFIWLTVFAVAVRVSITLFDIPHLALGAELATGYVQRSRLFAVSNVFTFFGSGAVILMGYVVFFPTTEQHNPGMLNEARYSPFALFFSLFMGGYILVSIVGTWKSIPELTPATRKADMHWASAFHEIRAIFRNRSFRKLFAGMFVCTFIGAIEAVFQPFMGFHFWGLTSEQLALGLMIGPTCGLPLAIWLIPKLTERAEKRTVLIGAFLSAIVISNWAIICRLAGFSWFPENGSIWVLVIFCANAFAISIAAPTIFSSLDSMMADIADEIDLETGQRREGILYSTRTFALKATSAIGLILGGALLDLIEFPENATTGTVATDVIWNLGFLQGPATSSLMLLGALVFLGYPLSRRRLTEVQQALLQRSQRTVI